jgi:hypothetical protein
MKKSTLRQIMDNLARLFGGEAYYSKYRAIPVGEFYNEKGIGPAIILYYIDNIDKKRNGI